ncbi:MAG: SMC-Scp complex subunit ScpB [Planctomycetota bacterium]|nr:MAG: SMC-Scp complex subunit ScpB [Planctomycetota bacterium]
MPQTAVETVDSPVTEAPLNEGENGPAAPIPGIDAAVEAMLLSVDRPIPTAKIAEPLGRVLDAPVGPAEVEQAIARLNEHYDQTGRAFRVEPVSGGYRLMTRPEHAPVIAAMHRARASTRLSRAALETLAIIAYRQPMTRAELEAIRGVACGEVLRSLMDRKMIKITGRAEELGRPMLYGTTPQFLDAFGLATIKDLPKPEELADRLEQSQAS